MNSKKHEVGDAVLGSGVMGQFTKHEGILGYNEVIINYFEFFCSDQNVFEFVLNSFVINGKKGNGYTLNGMTSAKHLTLTTATNGFHMKMRKALDLKLIMQSL